MTDLPLAGLFFAIGHEPATKFLNGQLELDAGGLSIVVSARRLSLHWWQLATMLQGCLQLSYATLPVFGQRVMP